MIILESFPVYFAGEEWDKWDKTRNISDNYWLEATYHGSSEEFVRISLRRHCEKVLNDVPNTISCDYLKNALTKCLLNEDNFQNIQLESVSTDLRNMFSSSMGESCHVVLDKAGPSLNMKITGNKPNIHLTFTYEGPFHLDQV